jgi:ribonuclease HI
MTDNKFSVFTDGSCLNNGKKNSTGAIGIFFSDDDVDNLGQAIDNDGNKVTNQTMELLACIQALKIIQNKISNGLHIKIIYIYTDSQYVINCITKWYLGWVKNGWINTKGKPVENKELIEILYELKSKFIVIFKHVRAHQDEPQITNDENYRIWYGNNMADKFATDACKEYLKDKQSNDHSNVQSNILSSESESDINKLTNVKKTKTTQRNIKKNIKNSLNV